MTTATIPRQRGTADQTGTVTLKEMTPEDVRQIAADLGPLKESTVVGWTFRICFKHLKSRNEIGKLISLCATPAVSQVKHHAPRDHYVASLMTVLSQIAQQIGKAKMALAALAIRKLGDDGESLRYGQDKIPCASHPVLVRHR